MAVTPLIVVLTVLIPLSTQHCLMASDEVRPISAAAHQALLKSELQFSTDLVRTVSSQQPGSNVFLSPHSVFQAMLLAYFVAGNHTEATLKTVLHLPKDQDKLDTMGAYTIDNYYWKLRSIKQTYQLSSANRLFVAKNLKLQHCMKVLFANEICPVNFEKNLSGVLRDINNWVARQTRHVIKDFLSKDSVTKDTKIVMANAAYFKGNWKTQFPKEDTFQGKFHLNNGSVVSIMMMNQENKFRLREDKKLGAEVLELPYAGDDISMYVVLPLKPSAIQQMLKQMDSQTLQNTVNSLATKTPDRIQVSIPKFIMEQTLELTPVLESMGVDDLFQPTADLSKLSGAPGLYFSEAVHKAKIQVDEKGTEAAAATALITARFGIDSFMANRPFVYFLYDKTSDILLFFGIFNSP